ncbi:S-adenosyl-L-methionine-dependent methyltransferase [Whalleya microplaca]|nr:S-adenosyl-L-methionine-dependent methyltransferase [Whalleya microplaca]
MPYDHGDFGLRPVPISHHPLAELPSTSDIDHDPLQLEPSSLFLEGPCVSGVEEDDIEGYTDGFQHYDGLAFNGVGDNAGVLPTNSLDEPECDVLNDTICYDGEDLTAGDNETTPCGRRLETPARTRTNITLEVPQSTLTQPRSHFEGFVPPAPEAREHDAIAALLEAAELRQSVSEEYIEFDLEDFAIYVHADTYPNELRPLQHLAIRLSSDRFYFDGVISFGETRFYLRRIPFRELPIGNYGDEADTVGDQIWIRSELNEKRGKEIYYKLKSPSVEYIRFHEPFLWIADLAKHVIDYCNHLEEEGKRAVLDDFKSRFSIWARRKHPRSAVFQRWHSANRSADFRTAIVANAEYIWKEAHGLDAKIISWHRFWKEIRTLDQYKPNVAFAETSSDEDEDGLTDPKSKPKSRKDGSVPKTIVTPYVHDLFSHMIFGNILKPVKPSTTTKKKQTAFVRNNRPVPQTHPKAVKRTKYSDRDSFIASIQLGDVISTPPDDARVTDTRWKQEVSKHQDGEHPPWFGLIQRVHQSSRGKRSFDVIWMYQSSHTPCGVMKYPWKNELFLSNNCTCHHNTAKIQADQILATHSVEWFGGPCTSAEFFVRQTYLTDDCRWITLKKEHLTCKDEQAQPSYEIGDTVLVETKTLRLETFVVEGFFMKDETRYARLRKLLRRQDVDKNAANAPPNELVYSNRLIEIASGKIYRRCLLRAFHPDEKIPTPYDRNGTGDVFFMTHQEFRADGKLTYVPVDFSRLGHIRQGFYPPRTQGSQMLQGLDLFCGSGNFGRGLEEGAAVQMRWANDIWSEAIHTYMANCEPGVCTPFLGSVDDLLLRALVNNGSKIPEPGDVQFISGGSPCPGFSLLTIDKTTATQRKNQSLVASFASYVDLYRPHYGVLENVPQMVRPTKDKDRCVFSQLVCALVGLGYQLQVMFLDAWAAGECQSRSRVFLCFVAPGFRTIRNPEPSHSHLPKMPLHKFGETSCGLPLDKREIVPTSFKYVSAREAIGDLPDIQDGKADYCVGFPDHRLSIGYTPPMRKQILCIPTQPWGMGFAKAWFGQPPGLARVMSAADRQLFPPEPSQRTLPNSKGWVRIRPDGLISTISTKCLPTDSRVGAANHWHQPRPTSIMEVKRAQGFLDHEVLVGSIASQWRLVGNSVARKVSLALGLAIREAWFGTLLDEAVRPQEGVVSVSSREVADTTTATTTCLAEKLADTVEEGMNARDGTAASDSSETEGPEPEPEPFLVPTPPLKVVDPISGSSKPLDLELTPATSEFSDPDGENGDSSSSGQSSGNNGRKRSSTALYVEIFAKKPRLLAG